MCLPSLTSHLTWLYNVPLILIILFCQFTTISSLAALNSKLGPELAVDQRTFRPNLVVAGPAAWAEDTWTGEVRVGGAVLQYNKPCTRSVENVTSLTRMFWWTFHS